MLIPSCTTGGSGGAQCTPALRDGSHEATAAPSVPTPSQGPVHFLQRCLAPNQELKLGLIFHAGALLTSCGWAGDAGVPVCQPPLHVTADICGCVRSRGAGGDFKALLR